MIENVDPDDTNALDEIDARVWCWLNCMEFISFGKVKFTFQEVDTTDPKAPVVKYNEMESTFKDVLDKSYAGNFFQYTRSRDALKAIRPESEWCYKLCMGPTGKAWFEIYMAFDSDKYPSTFGEGFKSPVLPTEELAELHAIIQSITYDTEDEACAAYRGAHRIRYAIERENYNDKS